MDTTASASTARYRQLVSRRRLGRQARNVAATLLFSIAPVVAVLIWVPLLRAADTHAISDLGLITAIPPIAYSGLLILLASFAIAINQAKPNVPVLLLHIGALIFCLYGAGIFIEGQPRTAIAWKLVGIMDQVMHFGSVDATKDAFQNWPGFFILVAFVSRLAGIDSPLLLAAWAHVFFNLLYLGPLVLLFRTATRDQRLIWLAVWFFYICNWIGQDYLAPQALGYFFYLLSLGILLTWFQGGSGLIAWVRRRLPWLPARLVNFVDKWLTPDGSQPVVEGFNFRQSGLVAVLAVFMLVMVPSHQLSPVALLAAIGILVVAGRIRPRGLPLLLGVMIVGYIGFMTMPYLRGHIDVFTKPLGDVTANVNENVTARVRGSALHHFVVLYRIVSSFIIWLIAGFGVLRRLRSGHRDVAFLLLAAVPFGLLGLQTYGGELLLRTFLFALPFAAFFMAGLFVPRPDTALTPLKGVLLLLVSAALTLSFFLTRYGNERMDYFTDDEVAAVQYIYDHSEPGALIVSGTESLPWRYTNYNSDRYTSIERAVRTNDLKAAIDAMSLSQFQQSFLILTRSQEAAAEMYLGWEQGAWEKFEANVAQSDAFRLVYSNADAVVYVLVAKAGAAQP